MLFQENNCRRGPVALPLYDPTPYDSELNRNFFEGGGPKREEEPSAQSTNPPAAAPIPQPKPKEPSSRELIGRSLAASVGFSVPIVFGLCTLAEGVLRSPILNAALGVVGGFCSFVPAFIGVSLFRERAELKRDDGSLDMEKVRARASMTFKFIAAKEVCEYVVRFSLHAGLMAVGFDVWSALAIASAISGIAGHLAVPWFRRHLAPKPQPQPEPGK